MDKSKAEKDLSSYIGRILRDHFGRGPGSVFVTLSKPYVTMYFTEFLSPTERSLLNTNQAAFIQKIRDMLMEQFIGEITDYLKMQLGMDIQEFYYDWNLDTQTGIFVAVSKDSPDNLLAGAYKNQEQIHTEIDRMSFEAEKSPEGISSYLLNARTLIIFRDKILVNIEKELIALGADETLRIAKRRLERRLLGEHTPQLEKLLGTTIADYFIDWDFELDRSAAILILEPIS
ncbi:Na-translocating system protein MpsC family protein [Fictibacillus sp. KU28468]|uniref:Na-translocating system protein MpsC family protein n=1 Tax=Fictibacillus sp. KU28468 TaxID=2991053 RepID=UPI00223D4071|nr:Na-translocating system protein MpsC family protein [Fictibacillus sp. KU28468]UZJ79289.1 DUF2294 domain-containing protein [Fictibacillus sp. KU28468]